MLANFIILIFVLTNIFFFGIVFLEYHYKIRIINHNDFLLSEILTSGIFFLSSILLLLNFFINLANPIVYAIFFCIVSFGIVNSYKIFYLNFKKIILFCFIFSPFIFILELGYDGALYHLPYQVILRDEKIIIGLTNLHNRYGLTGIYNYLVAPFWAYNFFNFQSALSTVFYLILYLFLYEQLKINSFIKTFLLFPAFFISFLCIRYAPFSYSQIDFVYGCLYFISIIYGIYILIDNDYKKNKNLFLFIVYSILAAMSKPSGFLISIFVSLIIFSRIIIGNLNIKNLFKLSIFPLSIYLLWLVRNIISTGCIFYPITFTCLNFEWSLKKIELYNLNNSIYEYAFSYFIIFINKLNSIIFINKINLIYIILSFIVSILFFFKFKNFFLNFTKKNKYIFLIILITLLIFVYIFRISKLPINGISNLMSIKDFKNLNYIFQFEFINLITVSLIIILFAIVLYFYSKSKKNNLILYSYLIPFVFLIFNIIILLKFAPNPRFGIGIFLTFFSSIFILFIPKKDFKINKYVSNLFIFSFFILLLNFYLNSNLDKFKNKNLIFNRVLVEFIDLSKRNGFGYKPLHQSNRPDLEGLCYFSKDCYPYDDVNLKYNNLGYKIYYK